MAYDETLGKVLLFGGCARFFHYQAGLVYCYEQQSLADTWSWDGVDWTQVVSPLNPAPRFKSAMAYDSVRKRLVMLGGSIEVVTDAGPPPPGGFEPTRGNTWTWTYGGSVDSDAGAEDGSGPVEDGPNDACTTPGCDGSDDASSDAIADANGSVDAGQADASADSTNSDETPPPDVSAGDVGLADDASTSPGSGPIEESSACACMHVGARGAARPSGAVFVFLLLLARRARSRFKKGAINSTWRGSNAQIAELDAPVLAMPFSNAHRAIASAER